MVEVIQHVGDGAPPPPPPYLAGHNGGQVLLFVHQHQVLERAGLEEEGVSFLQWHG